jgi:hypothetical protein
MRFLILTSIALMCFACTTVDEVPCSGYGELYKKEMPSYDWYHVLNVSCGGKKSFILSGEIKE